MTDIELWTRILKGDKVAFEELYHRYYSSLFGYALRLNFDEETIKDCLQDMFVKIWRMDVSKECTFESEVP